jgi:hypothetical protein
MPVIFYQSNFCPECGNRHEANEIKRRWLQHRYFCLSCAARLGHRWDWLPIALGVLGLSLGTLLYFGHRPVVVHQVGAAPNTNTATAISVTPVSAQDATAQLKAAEITQPIVTYRCGARTQKGTPCKHLVPAQGLRCFQHQGMSAMKR